MAIAWILGSTGLLGSALTLQLRRQGTPLFFPNERLNWDRELELPVQLATAMQAFAELVTVTDGWEIYWAAGVGTFSSAPGDLVLETRILELLLQLIELNPTLTNNPGALAFASSAGAIYAGSKQEIISEKTEPAPTTAYAHEKLKQEALVKSFAAVVKNSTALLARISTIYGPGQATGKQQGLLAHIARCTVRNRPIQIFVPYDTIRDYIAVDDAAASMIASLRAIDERSRVLTKIIASEHPTTIAEIISTFRKITRRAPKIVTSANKLSSLYSRRVQFRSGVLRDTPPRPCTSLLIGIAQLMAAERAAYARKPL